jgi:diaminohydroxyphosphoribosylaminopyrimidine deaminase/5-amino-6-(5-phosphoribosylamino)uracil reductase
VTCGNGPQVDLRLAMQRLGQMDISSILLEAGGTLNGAMLAAGLIDKAYLFFAPKWIGGAGGSNFQFAGFRTMDEAIRLERTSVEQVGDDFLISGYVARRSAAEGG